jgi:penicillin-binding protein 2
MSRIQRQKRIVLLLLFFMLAGFSLLGRVFYLQVLHGHRYARANINQRTLRYDYRPTGRGQILDRDGHSLLNTRWEPVYVLFEPLLAADTRAILERHHGAATARVVAVPANSTLARELGTMPREGVVPAMEETRYGQNGLAAHVTGYIQKSGASEPTGLEKWFNEALSAGRPYSLAAFVDAHGNLVEGLGIRDLRGEDPRRPYSVQTTIDAGMQRAVEQALTAAGHSSAVVIMDPQNGDILTMASHPWVNPWEMYGGVSAERMRRLQQDSGLPFINKAIREYPPGSVFKVILTAAALSEGFVGAASRYTCQGSIDVGDRTVRCFNGTAHGELDLDGALTVSCNSYFVWLGQKLGRPAISGTAEKFMLGRPTGIPLEEKPGLIPAPEAMPLLGQLANTSIGQGDVLVTPLQLTRMMAAIANDGTDVYPRLVSEVMDNQGRTVQYYPAYKGNRVLSPAAARRLQAMLQAVVDEGTGRAAQSSFYRAAGKTGTAQAGGSGQSHSWFSAIVNMNGRTLVATVFLENQSSGATNLFRQIMESLPGT